MQITPVFNTNGLGVTADFQNAVKLAISYFDRVITNNVTLDIAFNQDNLGATGVSQNTGTFDNFFSYATVVNALRNVGALGSSGLPATDPFTSADPNWPNGALGMTNAEAKVLGLSTNYSGTGQVYIDPHGGIDLLDGTVTLNNSLGSPYSFKYDQLNIGNNQIDAVGALEHEISEVLGRGVPLYQEPGSSTEYPAYSPEALFIYSNPGQLDTNLTTTAGYFSIDGGKTNLGQIGEQASGGDVADWTDQNNATKDSFGYLPIGTPATVTGVDLQEMNALGWSTTNQSATNEAFIYQSYLGLLGRAPDAAGFDYWMSVMNSGASQTQMLQNLMSSAEYQSTYGNTNNFDYVEALYQNVLGRQADTSGLSYWTSQLARGTSRASVALSFIGSPEDYTRQQVNEQSFMVNTMSPYNQHLTYNFYEATFGRQPDVNGYAYWAGELSGGMSQSDMANAFISSSEYQARYGNTNNTQFVTLLYQNALGRQPDQTGLNYWVNQLNSGASRTVVFFAFAASSEDLSNTQQAWTSWMTTNNV